MYQWQMTDLKEAFRLVETENPDIETGYALVKVAGCGVCHTDLSFWHHGVKTKHALPLTLGHEISGTVVDGPDELIDKPVIVPAVIPCGTCELCQNDRSNICRNQLMPGNDFHGGFASHVKVPARYLCPVPEKLLNEYALENLSVIADAISTPFQVIEKSELEAGDLAIVVGTGGIGIYAAQLAKSDGATVIALDIDDDKLKMAKEIGIDAVINIRDKDLKEVRKLVQDTAKQLNVPATGWKIIETSGTKAGQETAFRLITYASTLSIVGFTMEKLELRLSNLMAFDAKVIGTWGCRAELYPLILGRIARGDIKIMPFVQTMPMSEINEVFNNTLNHRYNKRTVLVPDF